MKSRTVSAAAEVKRLRRQLTTLRSQVSSLLAAQVMDPDAEYRAGWDDCLDRFTNQIGGRVYPANPTELETTRHHLCCGDCRRSGHRSGCARCEDRSREAFGQPHPDDFTGHAASGEVAA